MFNFAPYMDYGCDILLAGTMGDIGAAVKDSLESHGLSVVIMDFPQNVFRDEFGYSRKLMKSITEFRPRVIFPIGNSLALSRYKPKLPEGITAPVDCEENIRLLDSKVSASRLAASLGILQPRMYDSPEDIGEGQVVFKRDVSFGGMGVHLPWNRKSLDNLIAHQRIGEPYLIEDFIEGEDYSIDCIRWDGEFVSGSYRVLQQHGRGPSTEREKCDFPELASIARKMLDHIDYRGICGMDFRVDAEGKAYFLECNPRFTGGVGTQIQSGLDLPWLLYKFALGLPFNF